MKIEVMANAIARAAREEGANEIGKLMKFAKGSYFVGTEEVPLSTQFVARFQCAPRGSRHYDQVQQCGQRSIEIIGVAEM